MRSTAGQGSLARPGPAGCSSSAALAPCAAGRLRLDPTLPSNPATQQPARPPVTRPPSTRPPSTHPPTIPPARPPAHLAAQVPQLDGDPALADFAHVEAHGGHHVLMEAAGGEHIDQRCLPRVLQPNQAQLHLLVPEQAAQPVQEALPQGGHGAGQRAGAAAGWLRGARACTRGGGQGARAGLAGAVSPGGSTWFPAGPGACLGRSLLSAAGGAVAPGVASAKATAGLVTGCRREALCRRLSPGAVVRTWETYALCSGGDQGSARED